MAERQKSGTGSEVRRRTHDAEVGKMGKAKQEGSKGVAGVYDTRQAGETGSERKAAGGTAGPVGMHLSGGVLRNGAKTVPSTAGGKSIGPHEGVADVLRSGVVAPHGQIRPQTQDRKFLAGRAG